MENIHLKLTKKGWGRKHIRQVEKIISKHEKHPYIKALDKSVYWISLFLALITNLIVSIALIPFLLTLKDIPLYTVIVALGISFGLLFELLLRTMEHLQPTHHFGFGLAIPIITLVNIVIIVGIANNLNTPLVTNTQNPILIANIYAFSMILPYAFYHLFLKNKDL